MKKTVTIEDVEYPLETMTLGDGLDIQEAVLGDQNDPAKASQRMQRLVAASMRVTLEELRKLPYTHYQPLLEGSLEVNGMKVAESSGETQAGASPAA